jgi:hypothetical protein
MVLGLLFAACGTGWTLPGDDDTNDAGQSEDEDGNDDASDDSGNGDDSGDDASDDDNGTSPDDDSDSSPDDSGDGDGDGDADDDSDGNMSMDPYDVSRCDDPNLVWRSGNKTWYESYPKPGSRECDEFNGCKWAGQFAACGEKQTEEWVSAHNIVSAFPDFGSLERHDVCLRDGDNVIVATVLDTCGDHDCMDCCSNNLGDADQLIDVEKYTEERWGVEDGPIEWADLGPSQEDICE